MSYFVLFGYNRKEAATKQISKRLHKGYVLTTAECYRCNMPMMKKNEQIFCVSCPAIARKAKRSAKIKRSMLASKTSNVKFHDGRENVEEDHHLREGRNDCELKVMSTDVAIKEAGKLAALEEGMFSYCSPKDNPLQSLNGSYLGNSDGSNHESHSSPTINVRHDTNKNSLLRQKSDYWDQHSSSRVKQHLQQPSDQFLVHMTKDVECTYSSYRSNNSIVEDTSASDGAVSIPLFSSNTIQGSSSYQNQSIREVSVTSHTQCPRDIPSNEMIWQYNSSCDAVRKSTCVEFSQQSVCKARCSAGKADEVVSSGVCPKMQPISDTSHVECLGPDKVISDHLLRDPQLCGGPLVANELNEMARQNIVPSITHWNPQPSIESHRIESSGARDKGEPHDCTLTAISEPIATNQPFMVTDEYWSPSEKEAKLRERINHLAQSLKQVAGQFHRGDRLGPTSSSPRRRLCHDKSTGYSELDFRCYEAVESRSNNTQISLARSMRSPKQTFDYYNKASVYDKCGVDPPGQRLKPNRTPKEDPPDDQMNLNVYGSPPCVRNGHNTPKSTNGLCFRDSVPSPVHSHAISPRKVSSSQETQRTIHLNIPAWVDEEMIAPLTTVTSWGDTSMDLLLRKIDEIENDFGSIVASLPCSEGMSVLSLKDSISQDDSNCNRHEISGNEVTEILHRMRHVQDQIEQIETIDGDDVLSLKRCDSQGEMAELIQRLANAAESLRTLQLA
eukprot:scaffold15082_cov207-Alexandrium_tamarense.AAC.3